jgi:hypothetical protein
MLRWEDEDDVDEETRRYVRRAAPCWEEVDLFRLLPESAAEQIDEMIEERLKAQEQSAASPG